jgi:hypothetical protein
MIENNNWDIFDALTCDHPMLVDIADYMLFPFTEGDYKQWRDMDCERLSKAIKYIP